MLGLEQERISVTVFVGDEDAPRDDEAVQVWLELGIPQERIYYLPKEDNWWPPVGKTGPCGPDSELFYDTGRPKHGHGCRPGCSCGKYIEIGNNVFMQYIKTAEGTYVPLKQRNIDVGIGLERTLYVHQRTDDVFSTDLFMPIVHRMNELHLSYNGSNPGRQGNETTLASRKEHTVLSTEREQRLIRIITDHVRAATFIIADGVIPGNVEQGYVCRRLIRRAIRCGHELNMPQTFLAEAAQAVIDRCSSFYPFLEERQLFILNELTREEERFGKTLSRGLREFQKQEERLFKEHQERSRRANVKRFAGGLADHSERTTQLHTATHLLQQALRDVLGTHLHQVGSNITPERLRFDFSHPKKLTSEEIQRVEEIVNRQISRDLQTTMDVMPLQQAFVQGALAFFGGRYGDVVKVYKIGDYAMEVCDGPHVQHTGEMGRFHIIKAETIGQGVQRIRADLVETDESS